MYKTLVVLVICSLQFTLGQVDSGQVEVNPYSPIIYNISFFNNGTFQEFGQVPSVKRFINETVSRIATGICFKEVPTSSLGENYAGVRGNGSNPSLSRIQVCCEGFEQDPHIVRKCHPICRKPCVNGICVSPERCICFPNHIKDLDNNCVPTCSSVDPPSFVCLNGRCNGDTCVCNPGYQLHHNQKICVPVCNPGCGNGNCTEPNTCSCSPGFEISSDGRCAPKCSKGCEFGECVAPEVCSCRSGYKLQATKCEPVCSRGCVNGRCVGPNTCACDAGWNISPDGTRCEAKCDRPCLNGACNGPNRCACNPGYTLDPADPFKCIADCPNGCPNGVCSGPGLCICNAGFVKEKKGSQNCVPRT